MTNSAWAAVWSALCWSAAGAFDSAPPFKTVLPPTVLDSIRRGKLVVLPNWLPEDDVAALRADAVALHRNGHFSADALAAYGAEKSTTFDPARDRMVLRLGQWKDPGLANFELRSSFGQRMASLRKALAEGLDRPKLLLGASVNQYGAGSTEISYTRYGPGAFLKRHTDEHHEELKGKNGWLKPTRRSISWLVYLNEDWDPAANGGELRCFERRTAALSDVGATADGDLQIGAWMHPKYLVSKNKNLPPTFAPAVKCLAQVEGFGDTLKSWQGRKDLTESENRVRRADAARVPSPGRCQAASSSIFRGWLRATAADPVERPVFLDSRRPGRLGNCALYLRDSATGGSKTMISRTFFAQPVLFLAGDFFAQRLVVDSPGLAPRFHFIEPPKSPATTLLASAPAAVDEVPVVVPPLGGTLVLFDSVSLPHEVLATRGRERWACSGWMHEDQQKAPSV